jgi:beta-lactamase class A
VKKNTIILILVILSLASISFSIYIFTYNKVLASQSILQRSCNPDTGTLDYQLLSPDIAWLSANEFLVRQQQTTTSYADLKKSVSIILQNAQGDYAFYFEDLTTGAWVGINENKEFMPLSLFKVPVMIATLKEVEIGQASLDQKVVLDKLDIDNKSGLLWKKGSGYEITVKDLLINLIHHSDNTASEALTRHVISKEIMFESVIAMGLPEPTLNDTRVTAREYSNMLRSLYFSNYLRRPFSELALTIMLESDFNSQIPAGLPKNIKVAHKVGFYVWEGYYHDCGIIYAPNKPYLLCVMSMDSSAEEADKIISQLSKIVYSSVTANNATTYIRNSTNNS